MDSRPANRITAPTISSTQKDRPRPHPRPKRIQSSLPSAKTITLTARRKPIQLFRQRCLAKSHMARSNRPAAPISARHRSSCRCWLGTGLRKACWSWTIDNWSKELQKSTGRSLHNWVTRVEPGRLGIRRSQLARLLVADGAGVVDRGIASSKVCHLETYLQLLQQGEWR
jgi:hypothetical protein